MSGIIGTGLENYIKRNAREQAMNQIAQAESQAQEILAAAKKRAALIAQESRENTAQKIEQNRRRYLAQAELKASHTRIARRETMIDEVWNVVMARIANLRDPGQRRELVRRLVLDAARQLGGQELELQMNALDLALWDADSVQELQDDLRARANVSKLSLSDKPVDITAGAIVRRLDGAGGATAVVVNSLEARLRIVQTTEREAIYALLSGETRDSERGAL